MEWNNFCLGVLANITSQADDATIQSQWIKQMATLWIDFSPSYPQLPLNLKRMGFNLKTTASNATLPHKLASP
jgi:hypothetical protein